MADAPPPPRPPRVLIADDNPQGVELLEAYLGGTDFETQVAYDGEETLRKVREWHPDLILLDVMMPRISGFEVCKRLKARPETADIVVLMVTALDQPSDIDRGVEAGTDDFLTKPINKAELLLRVRAALKSRQHKQPLDQTLAYIEGVQGGVTTSLPRVVLRARRAKPFFGMHPWVYAGAVDRVEGEPADGDVVDLVSHAGNFIARGLYNGRSKLRVRLYSWDEDVALDADFFRGRLRSALELRRNLLGLSRPGRACRLVYSESDGLSGLIVDQYDRWLVVQPTSLAVANRRELFADLLTDLVRPEGIYLRTERGIGQLEGLELHDGLLRGTVPADPVVIEEGGLRFLVNLAEGQKTGFYLDQRDNRQAVARLAAGRRVLDGFCYTGGFALHAARTGASSVLAVDGSDAALHLARQNAELNGLADQVTFEKADLFDRLETLVGAGEQFGLVVLDPPKFARSGQAVEEALRGYRRLAGQSLRLLEPGGVLAMCCCTGLIPREQLHDLLAQVAAELRRPLQILESRGPSPDHPVSATCPETAYLKCVICRAG